MFDLCMKKVGEHVDKNEILQIIIENNGGIAKLRILLLRE